MNKYEKKLHTLYRRLTQISLSSFRCHIVASPFLCIHHCLIFFGFNLISQYNIHSPLSVVITLPEWTTKFYNERKNNIYTDEKEMMRVAMELSKVNIDNETGGPFGTAIFEYNPNTKESKLFSLGVNRVVPLCNSTLHGEMTAIQFGQQRINNFSFAGAGSAAQGNKQYHLYTSAAPCCQCLGGIMWSGVSKLVCGATKDDVESIGFHEGPVFDPMSYDALEDAGCTVVREVLREECAEVLQYYKQHGEIYNP